MICAQCKRTLLTQHSTTLRQLFSHQPDRLLLQAVMIFCRSEYMLCREASRGHEPLWDDRLHLLGATRVHHRQQCRPLPLSNATAFFLTAASRVAPSPLGTRSDSSSPRPLFLKASARAPHRRTTTPMRLHTCMCISISSGRSYKLRVGGATHVLPPRCSCSLVSPPGPAESSQSSSKLHEL